MLIRSQDKLDLVKLDDLGVVKSTDNKTATINMYHHESHFKIGKYSSIEKALKVLDMIQKHYGNIKYHQFYQESLDFISPVFEMPQDDEAK